MSLFLVVFVLNLLIVFPTMNDKPAKYCQYFSGVSTLVVFLAFLYASCKDPGIIKPDEN